MVWIRSPLLVGREPELNSLVGALHDARTRRGGAVFLVGEAGIGKSRLAMEITDVAVADGVQVLRGRGSSIGPMVPFRPLTEALLALVRNQDVLVTAELGPYLPALGMLVPDWRHDTEHHSTSLVVIAEAVLRLLTTVSRETGCLLVLDDLHEADAETLYIVEYLIDNLAGSNTLLVGTIRSGQSDALNLARSCARRRSGRVVELAELGTEDVRRMAASCLDSDLSSVPEPVAEQLWQTSTGSPFIIEELLHEWVNEGLLARGHDGWRLVRDLPMTVPAALVQSIAARTEYFGPQGIELLSTGAMLGHKFPVSVAQQATKLDDRRLLSYLQAGVSAQLIAPDESTPGWYAFRHPVTAEALLAQLAPTTQSELAARVSDAVESLYPGLPGEWCPLVASLRLTAGDRAGAGLLFAEAGERALTGAAACSAVTLLSKADDLLAGHPDVAARGAVREKLVYALGETGQFERAFALATSFAATATAGQATALHIRLAWVAYLAGRCQDGLDQVAAARARYGEPSDVERAPIDAVHANLLLEMPGKDNASTAERLARQALSAAEEIGEPAICCQALQVLGILARDRDLDEAERQFERARRISEEHHLPLWRTHILIRLAGHRVLTSADTSGLAPAKREATRTGAITATCSVDAVEALNTVLCGDFDAAERLLTRNLEAAKRFQLTDLVRYAHATRAIMAAHQGRRPEMEFAIADVRRGDGAGTQEEVMCLGLARTFCALLEEDPERARRELLTTAEHETAEPSGFRLTGQHGLRLLLSALAGDHDLAEHRRLASTTASRMRWNRQFVHWADAVLLGRSGDRAAATSAAGEAMAAAEPYRMAGHLATRLIAGHAAANGWGDPVGWLRAAEEYFHHNSVPAVASACRALLRRHGEPVRQRRIGHDQVPAELRDAGITVREYDVFRLLAERFGNKDIARRLHISPKTVEKHVASLLAKTARPNRVALSEYASVIID